MATVLPSQQAAPLGVAVSYGALEQYMKDRDFALNQQQVVGNQQLQAQSLAQRAREASMQASLDSARLQQQGAMFGAEQRQRAYEFDAKLGEDQYRFDMSRVPSELDVFQQEAALEKMEKSAELQVWANGQEMSQQEAARLKEMRRRVGEVEAMPWTREEKDEALAVIKAGIDPLDRKQQRQQIKNMQAQEQLIMQQVETQAQATTRRKQLESQFMAGAGLADEDLNPYIEQDREYRSVYDQTATIVQQAEAKVRQGVPLAPEEIQAVQGSQQQLQKAREGAKQRAISAKLKETGGFPTITNPATGQKIPFYMDHQGNPQTFDFPRTTQPGKGEIVTGDDVQDLYKSAVSDVERRLKLGVIGTKPANDPYGNNQLTPEEFNKEVQGTMGWMKQMRQDSAWRTGGGGSPSPGDGRPSRDGSTLPGPSGSVAPIDLSKKESLTPPQRDAATRFEAIGKQIERAEPGVRQGLTDLAAEARRLYEKSGGDVSRLAPAEQARFRGALASLQSATATKEDLSPRRGEGQVEHMRRTNAYANLKNAERDVADSEMNLAAALERGDTHKVHAARVEGARQRLKQAQAQYEQFKSKE